MAQTDESLQDLWRCSSRQVWFNTPPWAVKNGTAEYIQEVALSPARSAGVTEDTLSSSLMLYDILDATLGSSLTFLSITEKLNTLMNRLICLLQRRFITDRSVWRNSYELLWWNLPPAHYCMLSCSPFQFLLLFYFAEEKKAIRHVQKVTEMFLNKTVHPQEILQM